MKISLYTAVKNGIYLDFHVVAMLKHHLPLADEIIVHEGFSTDGTYEAIRDLDPKIKIVRSQWQVSKDINYYIAFKLPALRRCTGDWIIMLDGDEFIPEWEFDRIRAYLASTDDLIVRLDFLNFYGNYQVYHQCPGKVFWPAHKYAIHRNQDDIELWGDGSNVRVRGGDPSVFSKEGFALHHFGFVRHAARLRQKWRMQGKVNDPNPREDRTPGFLFNLFPHRWKDPQYLDDLALYEGPYIGAVRDDPQEFIRDNLQLVKYLKRRRQEAQAIAVDRDNA